MTSKTGDSSGGTASEPDLTALLESLDNDAEGDSMSVRDMLHAIGGRSHGPLLLVPALLSVSPLGAIPGASIVTGAWILLVAVQMLISQDRPWLPDRLLRVSFPHEAYRETVKTMKPWTEWIDRMVRPRWTILVQPPAPRLLALVCAALAVTYVPLAIVPMGVAVPGTANIFFAAALTFRDGVLAACGLAATAGTGAFLLWWFC
jgi:hypothetical protein